MNYKEPIIIEHLAVLSVKYNVYLSELYHALVSARSLEKSVCGDLSVEFRGIINEQAIFLITKAKEVVVQFRVDEPFLFRKNICFESWMNNDKIRKQVAKQSLSTHTMLIQNLRHGMKKINVEAKILEIKKPKLIHTQYENKVMLTNILIGDETGKVKLCIWGDEAKFEVGDTVQIKHASVRIFMGERQLSLGKTGSLNVLPNNCDRIEQQPKIISQSTVYS